MKKIYIIVLLGFLSFNVYSQSPMSCFVQIAFNSSANLCFGDCNGTATTFPVGVGPYTYAWSNGATTQNLTGLCDGNYTVTVTDIGASSTCTGSGTITAPALLTVTMSSSSNSATAIVSGGTFPYTYAWSPGGQTTMTATSLTSGSYTVTVTDANGCTSTNTVTVLSTGVQNFDEATGELNIFPVPASEFLNVQFTTETKTGITIFIHNMLGEVVFEEKIVSDKSSNHSIDISKLPAGVYFISFTFPDKTISRKIVKE